MKERDRHPIYAGGRALPIAAALGALGLALTPVAALVGDARRALAGYLFAFAFWIGLALGALGWLAILHAARAKWMVIVRRVLEHAAATLPVFALLFAPLVVGMATLYVWVDPPRELGAATLRILAHRRPWLNPTAFVARAAICFALWIAVAQLLRAWSLRQDHHSDEAGDASARLTLRQRRLGAASLPLLGVLGTVAAFDWLMSLHPTWASTIFGLYFITGNLVGGCALWIVITFAAMRAGLVQPTPSHWHSLGKLLHGMVCFWAYIAFSQYMLVWVANLPQELPWVLARTSGPWLPVAVLLFAGHFAAPFLVLLGREIKRDPARLSSVALGVLVAHALDVYWLVLPRVAPGSPLPRWTDLAALVGVGGAALAFGLWRARGVALVPVGDPYLAESQEYAA